MSRLPVPGSDDGVWGDILNDYLLVSHNADGSEKAAGLPAADPSNLTIDNSSYANDYSGSGNLTTLVFNNDTAALAIAQTGDANPQIIIGSNGSTALAFGDGTLDPFSDGANIWTDGVPTGLSGANLTLIGSGTRLTLGQVDPADAANPTITVWNDLQLTDLQQTVGVVFRARLGNPNGAFAGRQGDVVIDGESPAIWQCTTTGDSSTAVWQQIGGSQPIALVSGSVSLSTPSLDNIQFVETIPVDPVNLNYGQYQTYMSSPMYTFDAGAIATIDTFIIDHVDTRQDDFFMDVQVAISTPNSSEGIIVSHNFSAHNSQVNDTASANGSNFGLLYSNSSDLTFDSGTGNINSISGGTYAVTLTVNAAWD